jgi:ABC-type nitrate/sulfonate/bicarbonate transport system ATPase subunit
MLGYEIKGIEKPLAKTQALSLLKQFGLLDYAHLYPNTLSGGMKQKVSLLRTIAFNSSFLLLDEPFGSLDAITRSELHLYLLEIWKKLKLTIMLTTHDIREAVFLSDRVYILSKKPSQIIDCLLITLPRPRKLEDLTSEKFIYLEKKLMNLLKQSHILSS